jgi:triacylglycerol lipase
MNKILSKSTVPVAVTLSIRKNYPMSSAPSAGTLLPGEIIHADGYVTDGESIGGNSKWYFDSFSNYYWSGGCGYPIAVPDSLTDSTACLFGEMIQTAYSMFEKPGGSLTPPPDGTGFPDNWTMDAWLVLEKTASTPSYIKQDECFGFIAVSKTAPVIAVVFRGTDSREDWKIDFDVIHSQPIEIGGKVEPGFFESFNAVVAINSQTPNSKSDFITYLKTLAAKISCTTCVVSGHSLGASLAVIAAATIASKTNLHQSVYLFASPKTGDSDFVLAFNKAIPSCKSFINTRDLVPQLPPGEFYGHVGAVCNFVPVGLTPRSLFAVVTCNHSILTYLCMIGSSKFGLDPKCVAASGDGFDS